MLPRSWHHRRRSWYGAMPGNSMSLEKENAITRRLLATWSDPNGSSMSESPLMFNGRAWDFWKSLQQHIGVFWDWVWCIDRKTFPNAFSLMKNTGQACLPNEVACIKYIWLLLVSARGFERVFREGRAFDPYYSNMTSLTLRLWISWEYHGSFKSAGGLLMKPACRFKETS